MNFNNLIGVEYLQTKRTNSSTEKGVILTVDVDNDYMIGKGEDGKNHFFSFVSFKEGGNLSLSDENLLKDIREYLAEKDNAAKEAELAIRKKREEEIAAEKALEEERKALARKNRAKKKKK